MVFTSLHRWILNRTSGSGLCFSSGIPTLSTHTTFQFFYSTETLQVCKYSIPNFQHRQRIDRNLPFMMDGIEIRKLYLMWLDGIEVCVKDLLVVLHAIANIINSEPVYSNGAGGEIRRTNNITYDSVGEYLAWLVEHKVIREVEVCLAK